MSGGGIYQQLLCAIFERTRNIINVIVSLNVLWKRNF
jgi:hypothetical protein